MSIIWDSNLYDSKHGYVSEYGMNILEILDPKNDQVILDLGCGTGDLTKMISEKSKEVIGLDNSEMMIEKAKEKYPLINFVHGDIIDFSIEREFDAIFSNAVLHWIPNAEEPIKNINKHLKTAGRFVAEFGGKGCVQNIISELQRSFGNRKYPALNEMLLYPSVSEYSSLLENLGFEVVYSVLFDRPTKLKDGYKGLNNFIEMFFSWMFNYVTNEDKEDIINQTCKNLRKIMFINESWIADYRRIQIVGEKIS
jgi:trans-aconitate methyltransferase